MSELVLEVGCEEMPAPWLSGLTDQLRLRFVEAAERDFLEPRAVQTFATPRRLVLRADIRDRQPTRDEEIRGPSIEVAKDPTGTKWTRAAEGFAQRHGVKVEDLVVKDDPSIPLPLPQKVYVFAPKRTVGKPAVDVLQGLTCEVLRGLPFPKRMSWDAWLADGKGALPFGRPIRWVVALLDGVVIPFTIYALKDGGQGEAVVTSGDRTVGHRFLPRGASREPVRVRSFADLRERLRERYVLLDPEERRARIEEGLDLVRGAELIPGWEHLKEEWRDLVEYPTVVGGRIPHEFAKLPPEVRNTVIGHHQKYIPVTSSDGSSLRFAAVIDNDGENRREIVRGMERVVVARLRDAAFFFDEDMKRPLGDRVQDLAGVTFHQGLGTYLDKADRLVRLVDAMGAELGLLTKAEQEAAREAARLAKADLTTLMVREFPELQGVVGAIYMGAQGGHWPVVAAAVHWHYHPLSIEEGSPPAQALAGGEATVFGAVSVADKLDTLAGYFGLGLAPTGSSDPYGLRRAAQGVVRVLIDFWVAGEDESRPSLRTLVGLAVKGHGGQLKRPAEDTVRDLEAFLLDRLRYVLAARDFSHDEVEAALGAREPDALDDPHECWLRVRALHRIRSEAREDLDHLAVAFKRAKNILAGAASPAVDPALFQESAERELHAAVARLASVDGGYESRLRSLAGLRQPVDRFFDDVLVMAEDPKLRANRLGLLWQTLSLFYRIADISKLGG